MLNVYKKRFQNLNCPRPPGIYNIDEKMKQFDIIEVVPDEVHGLGWDLVNLTDDNTIKFTNQKYKTKHGDVKYFKVGVKNVINFKNQTVEKNLYPVVDPRYDIYEIGFSFLNNMPVSNKFEDFWETRRGRRYGKYIQYRKYREMIRDQYLAKDSGNKHDPEFEKYLVARKEKERKKREEKERKELEQSLFDSDYDSDF